MVSMRFKFSVSGGLVYVPHLGKVKAFSQALRRANIPVVYSQGYNPRPRLSLAVPLPVGISSTGEYGEVQLESDMYTREFQERLSGALPPGLSLLAVRKIYTKKPPLGSVINCARYTLKVSAADQAAEAEISSAVDELVKAEKLPVTKRRQRGEKTEDIRPGIYELKLLEANSSTFRIGLTCGVSHFRNVRPEDVVSLLSKKLGDLEIVSINRDGLYYRTSSGRLDDPLQC